jgi:hypothetical protein
VQKKLIRRLSAVVARCKFTIVSNYSYCFNLILFFFFAKNLILFMCIKLNYFSFFSMCMKWICIPFSLGRQARAPPNPQRYRVIYITRLGSPLDNYSIISCKPPSVTRLSTYGVDLLAGVCGFSLPHQGVFHLKFSCLLAV